MWKSTNEVIEGQMKSLKSSKVKMKVEIKELNKFIRQLVTPLATISRILATISRISVTINSTTAEVQALISQLREDRHFGQIGKDWIEKLKSEGIYIIE